MCLILVAWKLLAQFPLVVAANRDEFYARPSAPVSRWAEDPRIAAGRDLQAGGTWLGIRVGGCFAAVTNVREPGAAKGPRSRGLLPRSFLESGQAPGPWLDTLDGAPYSGFNLLLADDQTLCYGSNRDHPPRVLPPGVYGLSNHLLDTPWPKLVSAKTRFTAALSRLPDFSEAFAILGDRETVPDSELPQSGLSPEWERMLSAIFVQSPSYGTRASTVLSRDLRGQFRLEERRFGTNGIDEGKSILDL